jgi:hypothetical protein
LPRENSIMHSPIEATLIVASQNVVASQAILSASLVERI